MLLLDDHNLNNVDHGLLLQDLMGKLNYGLRMILFYRLS